MRRLACFILCTFVSACSSVPADLKKSDPTLRIPAIEQSVRNDNRDSEPKMVHDLNSDDPAIRFYAIQGLYRLTGKTFGYRYYDDELTRAQAIKKWDQWLQQSHSK
ncbi:MAG TPA: hypothetical protein VG722_11755 [Tepidisphaeraceae bacterium]|nr:hypothetical protein [Tepidisphaeraceae bacterium]